MSKEILAYHQSKVRDWVNLLAQIAEHESPTSDKAAVDRCGAFLKAQLEAVGAKVEVIPQAVYGDFLRAEFGDGTDGQILVLCHFDTVWPLGQRETMPVEERDGKLWGPGAYDMKCGVMYSIAALHALRDLGLKSKKKIVLLYNSEEEVGSLNSRAFIEAEAKKSDLALVLEPSIPVTGALKTSRKGVGRFWVTVEGKPSHAGGDPRGGISAIDELARAIMKLHALTDYEKGTYVNVGVVAGGTRPNVLAAAAKGDVDVRVTTAAEGERVAQEILSLTPHNPGAKITVTGGFNRPPMEHTPATAKLFARAQKIASEMGFELTEDHTGGGSDGNFTAAIGTLTLDGLGAVGRGAHAFDEQVEIAHIPQRVALLTRLLVDAL